MYYTVRDIIDIFHISKNTAYKLVHSVGAPTIRVGRKLLIDKDQFEMWLKDWSSHWSLKLTASNMTDKHLENC